MKTIHKIVLLILFIPFCSSAQNFTTGGLLEKKDTKGSPVFYQKFSKKKCTGNISGYVIPRHTKLGCSDIVASFLQSYFFDHNISHEIPFWDVAICVEGYLSKGKEVGDWCLSVADNNISAIITFNNDDYITIIVVANDSIIFNGAINKKERCSKKIKYMRVINNEKGCSQGALLMHDETHYAQHVDKKPISIYQYKRQYK